MSARAGRLSMIGLAVAACLCAPLTSLLLAQPAGLSDAKIASGLKETLEIGTQNAINLTGRPDGYFQNAAIKILMPSQLQPIETGLRAIGYGPQIDELVLSMNRAAERAAPAAKPIFLEAITAMSFDDVRRILSGSPTAATEYFQAKTSDKLTTAFLPIVAQTMNEVGVTQQYRDLLGKAQSIPFLRSESLDLDRYVVGKSLDGLFYVLGQEEQKIRTNPAARATDLLKQLFGH